MPEMLKGCTIVFERDLRSEEAEKVINAIKSIRGVQDVVPCAASFEDDMNRLRVRQELGEKLWKVLYPERKT